MLDVPLGVPYYNLTCLSGVSSSSFELVSPNVTVFWIIELRTLRLLMASDLRFVPNTVRKDACGDKTESLLFWGNGVVSSGN